MKNNISKMVFLTSLFLFNCNKDDDSISALNKMVAEEKIEAAKTKIKTKLSKRHPNDEIISTYAPKNKRELSMSNDRNRIVWTEDNTIYFRDLANPLTKKIVFPNVPVNINVSYDAEYAIIYFPLANGAGCKILAVALIENKQSYVSNSYVSCNTDGGISHDGTYIYYFLEDDLYQEVTAEPKVSKIIVDKKFFDKSFPNIRNKYHMYPIGKTFLIFAGDGGVYSLYWFNPKQNQVEKLLNEVASYRLFFGNSKNAYFVSGAVGSLALWEIKFSTVGKPIINRLNNITYREAKPWATVNQGEFISGDEGNLFLWGNGKPKKNIPIIANSYWVVARNGIIYEDNDKELILSSMNFTDEDWETLELYKKVKEKSEQEE